MSKYQNHYLSTPHWKQFSEEYKCNHPSCEICGIGRIDARFFYSQDLNVHHLHYDTLWRENWNDVQSLCRRCHEIEHNGFSDLPDWSIVARNLNPWCRRN